MPWNIIQVERNYPPKERQTAQYPIPLGATKFAARASRLDWPDTGEEIMRVAIDLSLDGGVNWINKWIGFGVMGGVITKPDSSIVTHSVVHRDLPEPTNPNRKIRGNMVNLVALRTAIEVEIV